MDTLHLSGRPDERVASEYDAIDPFTNEHEIEYWLWDGAHLIPASPEESERLREREALLRLSYWQAAMERRDRAQPPLVAGPPVETARGVALPLLVEELAPETRIGAYTVLRTLGDGGMGQVYLAHDLAGREVVVTLPSRTMIGDPAVYVRYQREVQISRLLLHPRVQHILDTDVYDGLPYVVVPYVAGETLRAYLVKHAPLPIPEALLLLDQLCDGVAYCHEQGVIHRDLTPEHIQITPTRDVLISDFGSAARLRGRRRITWAGSATVGTPAYMAPELVEGKRGDVRTDIYALGAIGYEMLAGRPPFSGDDPVAVLHQQLHATPQPLPTLVAGLPLTLDAVIQKALRRRQAIRYGTVEEFRQAVRCYDEVGAALLSEPLPHARPTSSVAQLVAGLRLWLVVAALLAGIIVLGILAQLVVGRP